MLVPGALGPGLGEASHFGGGGHHTGQNRQESYTEPITALGLMNRGVFVYQDRYGRWGCVGCLAAQELANHTTGTHGKPRDLSVR